MAKDTRKASFQSQFEGQSIFEAFVGAARKYGSKDIILEDAVGGKFSYGRILIGARLLGKRFAKITKKGEIVAAVIIFPARHPESYHRACAVEEITQILGLPNDSNTVKPSIFNDHSRYFELTEHDRWLLRALYQKGITPGMSRNETLTRVLAFLKRARPE